MVALTPGWAFISARRILTRHWSRKGLADEGIELDEIPTVRRRWDRENHHLDRYDLVVCDMGFPTSYTPRDDLIFSYLNRQREALRALHSYFLEVEQATGNDRSHGMIDHLNALLAGNWKSLISGWKKYAGFYAVVENVRAHHSSRGYHGTLAHVLLYTSDFRHALFTLPVAVLFGFLTPDEVVHLHEQHRDKTGLYFSLSGRLAVGPKSPLVKSAEEEREVSDWQAFGHWVEVVKKAKEFQVGR